MAAPRRAAGAAAAIIALAADRPPDGQARREFAAAALPYGDQAVLRAPGRTLFAAAVGELSYQPRLATPRRRAAPGVAALALAQDGLSMGGRVRVPAAAVAAQRLGDVLLDAAEGPVGAVDLVQVEPQLVVRDAATAGLFGILQADDPGLVLHRQRAQVFRCIGLGRDLGEGAAGRQGQQQYENGLQQRLLHGDTLLGRRQHTPGRLMLCRGRPRAGGQGSG